MGDAGDAGQTGDAGDAGHPSVHIPRIESHETLGSYRRNPEVGKGSATNSRNMAEHLRLESTLSVDVLAAVVRSVYRGGTRHVRR